MPNAKPALLHWADKVAGARGLYTPDILAAAMELTAFPWNDAYPFKGSARSRSCGSAIDIGLTLDAQGKVAEIGIKPHACAVGQAAAAVFSQNAARRDQADILAARQSLALWLAGAGPQPDWPGIALLDSARAYTARHGAILLAWDAALDALSK